MTQPKEQNPARPSLRAVSAELDSPPCSARPGAAASLPRQEGVAAPNGLKPIGFHLAAVVLAIKPPFGVET